MLTDLRKHFLLLVMILGLYIVSISVPYLFWFINLPLLCESWLVSISRTFHHIVFMFWVWLMVIGLIGIGAYWSTESNERVYFEVWRYRSYQAWLWKKICFVVFFNVILFAFGFLPFMLALYRGEVILVLQTMMFLILYSVQLSLMLLAGTMLGLKMTYAFLCVFSFHLLNVLFDGMGRINVIQYFLIGERAGILSCLMSVGLISLTIGIMLVKTSPMTILKKGS